MKDLATFLGELSALTILHDVIVDGEYDGQARLVIDTEKVASLRWDSSREEYLAEVDSP